MLNGHEVVRDAGSPMLANGLRDAACLARMPPDLPEAGGGELPLLAVVFGAPTFGVFDLAQAASGTCRLAFILECEPTLTRLLRHFGPVIDVSGLPDDEALDRARSLGADGITTFSDRHLRSTAVLAQGLGLPYHSPEVARILAHKYEQRRVLEKAGLPGPRFLRVGPDERDPGRLLSDFRYPVVVKPDFGTGSRETTLAANGNEVQSAIARAAAVGIRSVVIEEYLADDPDVMAPNYASFVSVESAVGAGGCIRHLAVTGKFPLAPPFRETGNFIPSHLSDDRVAEVLRSATAAIEALGIGVGAVHTEVKLTPAGVRIIEVNGRTGGAIPDVLAAASGVLLLRYAMQAALGDVPQDGLVPCRRIGYRLAVQPPTWATRVLDVTGIDMLPGPPVVQNVNVLRSGGDPVDWRTGTNDRVAVIIGSVESLAELEETRELISKTVSVTYG